VPGYRFDPERGLKDLRTVKPVYYAEHKTVAHGISPVSTPGAEDAKQKSAVFCLIPPDH
jgi:hypothetical protein